MNIPDAPPALRPLLNRLLAEVSTEITQHEHTPAADEWFAGRILDGFGGGDFGPYASAEDAIVGLVRRLWELYDEALAERDTLQIALASASDMRKELAQLRATLSTVGQRIHALNDDRPN